MADHPHKHWSMMRQGALVLLPLLVILGCTERSSHNIDSPVAAVADDSCGHRIASLEAESSSARVLGGQHFYANASCYIKLSEVDILEYECGAIFAIFEPADSGIARSIASRIEGNVERYYPSTCWGTTLIRIPKGTEGGKLKAAYELPEVFLVDLNYETTLEIP